MLANVAPKLGTTKQGDVDELEEKEVDGKEGVQHSARGEHHGQNSEHSGHGDGEESEGEEGKEELSALEKILPQFPASRKQVFLKVEAVLGLLPPFTARGSAVTARVFWCGQEVRNGKYT